MVCVWAFIVETQVKVWRCLLAELRKPVAPIAQLAPSKDSRDYVVFRDIIWPVAKVITNSLFIPSIYTLKPDCN